MVAAAKMKGRCLYHRPRPERRPSRSGQALRRRRRRQSAKATTLFRKCRELTDGYGCDVYIEATGHPAAVEQGCNMIRKLGTFVEFSVMREPVTVDWTIIGDSKELNVHGSHLGPYCYPVAIRMIEQGPSADGRDRHPPVAAHRLSEGHRYGREWIDICKSNSRAINKIGEAAACALMVELPSAAHAKRGFEGNSSHLGTR